MHHVLRGCRLSRVAWSLFDTDLAPDELTFILNCNWSDFFDF